MIPTYTLLLTCGHSGETYVTSETHYCFKCKREAGVASRLPIYRARCVSCGWGRGAGSARLAAQRAADAHSRSNPTHHLQVIKAGELYEDRTPRAQPPIPEVDLWGRLADDPPPF